ncbi:MAG: anti-sigma factor antagonist [Deltaproteobacteria bacterium]|nr:anti-sigma factor antagonist [Deltaproteobacteria bacterium]TLN01746.1 MAG: STAS domain-containing protein [bacterium]
MKLEIAADGGVSTLRFKGERLDAHNSEVLKLKLKEIFEGGAKNVLVDLAEVRFIDSSGLGALVSGFKNAVACKGSLALAGLQDQVRSMFELTRLNRVFDIYVSEEEALAALSGKK